MLLFIHPIHIDIHTDSSFFCVVILLFCHLNSVAYAFEYAHLNFNNKIKVASNDDLVFPGAGLLHLNVLRFLSCSTMYNLIELGCETYSKCRWTE